MQKRAISSEPSILRNIQTHKKQSDPKCVFIMLLTHSCICKRGHTPHSTRLHKQTHTAERQQSLRLSDQSILISSKANNGRGSRDCVGTIIVVFSYNTPVSPLGSLLLHTHFLSCVCVCSFSSWPHAPSFDSNCCVLT